MAGAGAAPLELPLHCMFAEQSLLPWRARVLFSGHRQGGGVASGGGSGLEEDDGGGARLPPEQGRPFAGRPASPLATMRPAVGLMQHDLRLG